MAPLPRENVWTRVVDFKLDFNTGESTLLVAKSDQWSPETLAEIAARIALHLSHDAKVEPEVFLQMVKSYMDSAKESMHSYTRVD